MAKIYESYEFKIKLKNVDLQCISKETLYFLQGKSIINADISVDMKNKIVYVKPNLHLLELVEYKLLFTKKLKFKSGKQFSYNYSLRFRVKDGFIYLPKTTEKLSNKEFFSPKNRLSKNTVIVLAFIMDKLHYEKEEYNHKTKSFNIHSLTESLHNKAEEYDYNSVPSLKEKINFKDIYLYLLNFIKSFFGNIVYKNTYASASDVQDNTEEDNYTELLLNESDIEENYQNSLLNESDIEKNYQNFLLNEIPAETKEETKEKKRRYFPVLLLLFIFIIAGLNHCSFSDLEKELKLDTYTFDNEDIKEAEYMGISNDDTISKAVRRAGGNVNGILRASIMWNSEERNDNDYDIICRQPNGKILYFGNLKDSMSGGTLDVDIIHPKRYKAAVENMVWDNKNLFIEGIYSFYVCNFSERNGKGGFKAEIAFNDEVYSFECDKPMEEKEIVKLMDFSTF